MRTYVMFIAALLLICASVSADNRWKGESPPSGQSKDHFSRSVAVTIDDLPAVRSGNLAAMQEITVKMIGHLASNGIPAIGFVCESKLAVPGEESERTALLEAWLAAGFDLGNHTYSHPSLYDTPLERYKADVIRGEAVTARLLSERGRRLIFFRHPRLNTGPDAKTRAAFEAFLDERGYTVAPVTIDHDEYVYALAYFNAAKTGENALMARIGKDYIRYMAEIFTFYEQFSRELLGREPKQILLLHANRLNADYLDELIKILRFRGYGFISLAEALEDPAYRLPDHYVGQRGLSWLHRWAVTMGREVQEQPDIPEWIMKTAWPRKAGTGN